MGKKNHLEAAKDALRTQALGYPETTEDFPWGHSAFKVKGKTFLFTYLNAEEGFLSLSIKLPHSGRTALLFPFAVPAGYGLGKSGWVTVKFYVNDETPLDLLEQWVEESYRAIAPKRVLAQMDGKPLSPKRKRGKTSSS